MQDRPVAPAEVDLDAPISETARAADEMETDVSTTKIGFLATAGATCLAMAGAIAPGAAPAAAVPSAVVPAAKAPNGLVLAQAAPRGAAVRPGAEARQEDQYLDVLRQLRSQCGDAAWTLWHSNSYDAWRQRKTPVLSLHYSSGSFPNLPPAPRTLPDAVRGKAEALAQRTNELLRETGAVFKDLADYINAKDYEDDKFKKGDALNAKLVAAGRSCHGLHAEMTGLYVEMAQALIEQRKAAAAKPDIVGVMQADWQIARSLSRELARHGDADLAKLDGLARDVTTLVEDRRSNFAPLKQNPDSSLKRFYEGILNDDVAVKMRRLVRDAKDPKAFKAASEDRPRSNFWSLRDEIDYAMPDAILGFIRTAK